MNNWNKFQNELKIAQKHECLYNGLSSQKRYNCVDVCNAINATNMPADPKEIYKNYKPSKI